MFKASAFFSLLRRLGVAIVLGFSPLGFSTTITARDLLDPWSLWPGLQLCATYPTGNVPTKHELVGNL